MPAQPLVSSGMLVLALLATGSAVRIRSPESRPHYIPDATEFDLEVGGLNLATGNAAACIPLENRGSHYTVRLTVGTPPRAMNVLADTGSDAVIIKSCQCGIGGGCDVRDKCFSPHRSSTFNQSHAFKGHAPKAIMKFGSGKIVSKVGSDIVRVGDVSAQLTEGLYMLIKRELRISGPFEGILGLGPPHEKLPNTTHQLDPYGFLAAAGIDRFSICLKPGGHGTLRLGTPPTLRTLGSMAKAHWGLSFKGVSVGDWHLNGFCSTPPARPGQVAACGALPDSGTTLITAPTEHLMVLFSHICDHWPRCNASFQNNSYHTPHKWFHFEQLLIDCHDWAGVMGTELNSTQISMELPLIRLRVAGQNGQHQDLRLRGDDYLVHMLSSTHLAAANWLGSTPFPYPGKRRKICSPAFHPMDTASANMGPIWILGLTVLHRYQVNYDRGAQPPTVSFSDNPCDSCDEVKLFAGRDKRHRQRQGGLLWLDRPPRVSPFAAEGL